MRNFGFDRWSWLVRWLLGGMIILWLAACTTHPGASAVSSTTVPSESTTEPPTEPFPRLETGMHTAMIRRIAVDAAERFLVTGSDDKTARVWALPSGKLLQILRPPLGEGHEGKVFAVAISPDGRLVAMAGWTGYAWEGTCAIYLFDRADGRLLRRIAGLPNVINHLAFSPDGATLAAALRGANGIRVYRAADGQEVARDPDYGDSSYSVAFDRTGRLVTTCFDGYVRLYDRNVQRIARVKAPGGTLPYAARFSPDGQLVAVGFNDTTAVNVLSGDDLGFRYAPDTTGVDNGTLSKVAWSRDGRFLYAGGRYDDAEGWNMLFRWAEAGRGPAVQWQAATDTLMELVPLADGGLAYGAADPAFGMFDAQGRKQLERRSEILDHRGNENKLRLSAAGSVVEFSFDTLTAAGTWQRRTARFELTEQRLTLDPPPLDGLTPPDTRAEPKENWYNTLAPSIQGTPLTLEPYETSWCLAFLPQGEGFLLGADWSLYRFDRPDRQRWRVSVPAVVWGVNVTQDGRYAVAALGDGTLRWYAMEDGREVLALFVHPDGQRWIAWTPEGFYDAAPGGEELFGYHLNQGKDQAGEFVAASQLKEQFYRPDLIMGRLRPDGDQAIAAAVRELGDIRQVLAGGLPPDVELLSPSATISSDGDYLLQVRVKNRGGGIDRLIYRIDGVEVAGRPADIPVPGTDRVSRRFPLAPGPHEVEAIALNRRGVASPAVKAVVTVIGEAEQPSLYMLAVGVSNYRDHSLAQGVRFAAADAETIKTRFEQGGAGLFRQVVARTLTDKAATRDAIGAAIHQIAGTIQPTDAFILYLAGHGASLDGEYHFVPWEARYTNRKALKEQSLGQNMLRTLLSEIKANKTLVLIDTCSSGGFSLGPSRGMDDKAAIDRLSRISGRAVLAASSSEQMALEGYEDHGVFTFALLQGLQQADRNNNGKIEVGELGDYIEETVPALTQKKWGYEQYPVRELHERTFPISRRP